MIWFFLMGMVAGAVGMMMFAGYQTFLGTVRWDDHLSYAWKTRNKEEALRVAEKFGGTVMLFNPIIWRTKKL